jgi:uncharacterized YigZ family protein
LTEFYVPAGYGEAEFIEKRSKFIGHVWLTETENEAVSRINETREKYRDANHNVYAYIIREGNTMRYSDDGEPQGTSGMPTLNVFRGEEIFNVCCVVTRYFGGTLFGTGGLARAYSHTAKLALEAAGISVMRYWDRYLISCSYGQYERIKNEIDSNAGIIEETEYSVEVIITVLLAEKNSRSFTDRLIDITAGRVFIEKIDSVFIPVRVK